MREPTDRPNIILINCDDLGYGDLGCYGSEVNATPVLDRMVDEGTRFTDFYMASPVCSPSRGAMMTGCYPPRIGFGSFDGEWVLFPGQGVGLNPKETTIAGLLKEQDYATMLVGKWHCGDQPEFLPTKHGFDHYFGIPFSNDMGRQGRKNSWPPLPLLSDDEVVEEQPEQEGLTERYVEHAVKFIRDNKEKPFFLYFAHMHVHRPILVSRRFVESAQNGRYGAAVECIDWAAGALFYELQSLGLDRNTLVVFTSDNGSRGDLGGSNGPLRGKKGSTWEGGQRLPFIARWPDQISAGKTCGELTTSMDFLPTFAGLAGAKVSSDRMIDGKDIRPLLAGEADAATPHKEFFYYMQNNLEAVRSGKWKLHVRKGQEEILELYDLDADIGEVDNVADQYADVVSDLQAKLKACREDIGDDATGVKGANNRPIGEVADPKPLTKYDPNCPYLWAEYDTDEIG